MTAPVTIERALSDPRLLGARFGDAVSWRTWFAILKASYGRPLTKAERAAFDMVAGGRAPPRRKVKELIVVASRRAGKGSIAGAVAAYEGALVQHDLAPGERGVIACVSATKEQAAIVREYAGGFFQASPILRSELVEATVDELRLRSGSVVATLAADYRSLRGRTLFAAILDEAAFLADDIECVRALLPGLATTGGMLIVLSSPFRRSGLLFERHREFFGRDDDDVLVVAGASELFNPTLDRAMLARARAVDPEGARAEWGGEFRSDSAALFDDAMLDGAVDRTRPMELPPRPGVRYQAFTDSAGGAQGDAYTVGIAHREADGIVVCDMVRGAVGKFDPAKVTADFAALLRQYGVGSVTGDAYAAGWVAGSWREHGIGYVQSERKASEIYLDTLPLFARGSVRLPDHPRLLKELRLLERHVGRDGRETVQHPRGAMDDHANAACGALRRAATAPSALWEAQNLIARDPVRFPPRADCLLVSCAADQNHVAAVFFLYRAAWTPPLIVLDFNVWPLAPAAFHSIMTELWRHIEQNQMSGAAVYSPAALSQEFVRAGYGRAELIDAIAADEMLAVSVAAHITAGRIKLAERAKTRTETVPLTLLDGTMAGDTDPVGRACLTGIACALNHKIGKGRAA